MRAGGGRSGLGKHEACFMCCKLPTSFVAMGFYFCFYYPEHHCDIRNSVLVFEALKPWSPVFACRHQRSGEAWGLTFGFVFSL